jgi:hypothetical protein
MAPIGPTFYQTLYGDRTDGIIEGAKEQIINAKERLHKEFHAVLLDVAGRAYAQGLKDGFAQGVAAEAASWAAADPTGR